MSFLNKEICSHEGDYILKIWDKNDFGNCFEHVILPFLPIIYIIILYIIRYINYSNNIIYPYTRIDTYRQLLCILLGLSYIFLKLICIFILNIYILYWQDIITLICTCISPFLLIFLTHNDILNGIKIDKYIHIFWLLLINIEIIFLRTSYIQNNILFLHIICIIRVLLTICTYISFVISSTNRYTNVRDINISLLQENENYEKKCSFFSYLTFSWMNTLMKKGRTAPLNQEDLYDLREEDRSEYTSTIFEEKWTSEVNRTNPSLWRALFRAFAGPFLLGGFFKFIYDSLLFVSPPLLSAMISFLENIGTENAKPWYFGYLYAGGMFFAALIQSVILHQYFQRCYRTGMRIRAAVTMLVYKKSLRIPSGFHTTDSSNSVKSTGEIANLMSVDSQRLQDLMTYLHILWSAPYQILLATSLLCRTIGIIPTMSAIAVLAATMPLAGATARWMKSLQQIMMKIKDERLKVTNEVLTGIKIIKLYAWEDSFEAKLNEIRNRELQQLWRYQFAQVCSSLIWGSVPLLVSATGFTVYVLLGDKQLDAATAFTSLALFNLLRFPMIMMPMTINNAMEASVALKRIRQFLDNPEKCALPPIKPDEIPSVKVTNGDFKWPNGSLALENVSFETKQGQLTMIIGATGAGKSALLLALLSEIPPTCGTVETQGSIAYVSQSAWIQNATVKDNILFGKPLDESFYDKVLVACALKQDLQILPAGDQTEIGERGINLSGGQKQRISVARAVYHKADIYFLDDCLSAVDAHVSRVIFQCITELLKDKCVLLVTHKLDLLTYADQILYVQDRTISFCGTFEEMKHFPDFENFKQIESYTEEVVAEQTSQQEATPTGSPKKSKPKLVDDESMAIGAVSKAVYYEYIKNAGGSFYLGICVICIILLQIFSILPNAWLSYWSDRSRGSLHPISPRLGLLVFVAISFVQPLLSFLNINIARRCGWRASEKMHKKLLHSILRAPMSFFDTIPLGRALNRFTKDIYTIDETLLNAMFMWASTLAQVAATVVVVCTTTKGWFLIILLPLMAIYGSVQAYYIPTSRQLKRLDSVGRSPIFSHFSESLEGVATVRAFRQGERFIRTIETKLDSNLRAYYMSVSSNRWLAIRLEFVGTGIVFSSALLAVALTKPENAGFAGLALAYALNITQTLNWMVRMSAERETNIVSVERVKEYSEIAQEAPAIIPNNRPPLDWPNRGAVSIQNISLRYRPDLPLVLRNINIEINPLEKIGVVGRTGAGKSSFFMSILRLVEPCNGSILVDGIDISTIGLKDLRSRFAIIPQDPVLFTGTIRFNLDPFSNYSDEDVWEALERAHLKDLIIPLGLSAIVEENGQNFSMGERQLICLARALLRRSKILLLDEATSAVDYKTTDLVQKTIDEEFKSCTVLTIAHRMRTIISSDKVIVLENGRVKELDSPNNLMDNTHSLFRSLATADGIVTDNNIN
eukprot:GHVL01013527.1.p1 GENE.GHVL01013527.1~~GHVL01013527.1.p1  ORF type:complete len:1441 (-),score=279.03 GHVL01013527.1:18-4340(-)